MCYFSNKYQPLNNLAKYQNFTQRLYIPPSFQTKIYAPHRRIFCKYRLFTAILVFLKVDEVCYISNKCQPPLDLVKRPYFYTRDFISLLHFGKNWRSPSQTFFETITFYHFFSLFLKVNDICNSSSKCWLPNKSANKIFLHKTPYTPFLFQIKTCALHRRIF